ncbi:MAG: right-handed parallel beta-helix repeat-containing protein [Balneolaceae bacterium]|nr:right-handed parallel beta-helix repeat-containing protein [Balneolaceae bacterium]
MNIRSLIFSLFGLLVPFIFLLSGCNGNNSVSQNGEPDLILPGPDAQQIIQQAFIDAEEGDVIRFGEGTFELTATITLNNKTGVTLKGSGRDETVFSFSGQTDGSDGLLISNSSGIIVQDLTISDTPGDGLKVRDTDGIVIYRVGAVWSGEPSSENGAYGIYPVLSSNVMIDESYAYGASDAGIYVGQSDRVIVRNSLAEGNVAGIEIENTTNADVYGNTVTDNTGGIMVFDLPWLSVSGSHVRVFNNVVQHNGRVNFAPAGNIVAQVPAGTGILVMSTNNVEVFDNEIEENNVIGTGVFSINSMIELGELPSNVQMDESYNTNNVYIHGNSYSRSNIYVSPEDQNTIGNLLTQSFGENPIPDIMLDGFLSGDANESGDICVQNNIGSGFVNLNIPFSFPDNISFDSSPHDCSLEPLPEVQVEIPVYN